MRLPEPEHARLPPSSASRWTVCTASVAFIEAHKAELPDDSSTFADEGTRAHACAAAALQGKLGQVGDGPEMNRHVDAYINWVKRNSAGIPAKNLWVEKRVPLFYLPTQKGTTDATAFSTQRVFVGDLKYGAGVSVDAFENKQLAIYAESVIREIEVIEDLADDVPVTMGIFQPRDRNNPEPERLWTITRGELRKFCQEIDTVAQQVLEGRDLKFVPGEKQCRICPAKGICQAYASQGLEVVPVEIVNTPTPSPLPDPKTITREQRQRVLAYRKHLIDWLDALADQETHELLNGAAPLQFKLVAGRSTRKWSDEAAAKTLLRGYLTADQTNPPSDLISPAQAEKLLAGMETSTRFENRFKSLVTKSEGNPTLAPITDPRPALQLKPASDGLENLDDVI